MSDHTEASFLGPKNFDSNHPFIMNVSIDDMIADPNTAGMYPQFHNFIFTNSLKCFDPSKYKGKLEGVSIPTVEKYRQLFYEMLHLMNSKDDLKRDIEQCNIENKDIFVENSQLRNSVATSISDKSMASFLRVLDTCSQNTTETQHCDITDNTWIHTMMRMRNEKIAREKFVDYEIELVVNSIATERTLLNAEMQDLKNVVKTAFSSLLTEFEDVDFERALATAAEKSDPFLSVNVHASQTDVIVESNDHQVSSFEKNYLKTSHTRSLHENAACQNITHIHKKMKKNTGGSVVEITQVPSNNRKEAEVFDSKNVSDMDVRILNLIGNPDIQTMYPVFYKFMATEFLPCYDLSNNKRFSLAQWLEAPSIEKYRQLCNEMLHLMYFKCHLEHVYKQRIAKNRELKVENERLRSYVVKSWSDVFITSFLRVFKNSSQDETQRADENCVRTEDTWDSMMTRLRNEKAAEGTILNDKIEFVVNNLVKEYPLLNKEKHHLKNILKTALTSGFTDFAVEELCSPAFQEFGPSLPARGFDKDTQTIPVDNESNTAMMSSLPYDFYSGFTCFLNKQTSKRKLESNALKQ